jgi:hypothetical protein
MSTLDLTTVSLSDFVRNAEIIWKKGAEGFVPTMRSSGIVKSVSIPSQTGNTREFSSIDLELYASKKAERDEAKYAKTQQGYSKVGRLTRFGKAQVVSHEWMKHGKYADIKATLTNLLPMGMRRMDLDLQHRFGFSTVTTMVNQDGDTVDLTVGDGLSLASTAHTVRGSAATYRNILANNPQFSRGALEAMEKMRVENSINQLGQKVPCTDDVLWSTDDPNTINTMREVLKATASVESGTNSGVPNTYAGKYRHVALPLVATDKDGNVDSTKAKYWGLCSTMDSSFYLGVSEEPYVIPPSVGDGTNVLTDDLIFNVRAEYMIVIPDPKFFALSKGDGTP